MQTPIACPSCGQESPGTWSRCPSCGTLLDDDDVIVRWVASPTEGRSLAADSSCSSCGYTGPMDRHSDLVSEVCPACAAVQDQPGHANVLIGSHKGSCPDCGFEIRLSEDDRGKTVICPRCKRFLGCLLRDERRKPWRRRAKA